MVTKLQKQLLAMQDEEYRIFSQKLIKTKYPMIGIRMPLLRKFAKDATKTYQLSDFKDKYYEEVLVKAIYIANYKCTYEEKLKLIEEFLPLVDNWAINDSFVMSLKLIKKNKESFFKEIKKYLKSNEEFTQRFALTVLLDYYVEEDYLNDLLNIIKKEKYNGYYSLMAGAWLLSYCFISFFDETLEFVNNNKLDDFIKKKGIQKSLDSYRLSDSQKQILRALNR